MSSLAWGVSVYVLVLHSSSVLVLTVDHAHRCSLQSVLWLRKLSIMLVGLVIFILYQMCRFPVQFSSIKDITVAFVVNIKIIFSKGRMDEKHLIFVPCYFGPVFLTVYFVAVLVHVAPALLGSISIFILQTILERFSSLLYIEYNFGEAN